MYTLYVIITVALRLIWISPKQVRFFSLFLFLHSTVSSKDPNQAVSGTFIYAMSAGCPIISTDFVLGREMLDAQTGVILTTNHENELADQVIYILDNPALKKEMSRNAFLKTKHFSWKNVGQQHVNLFNTILETAPGANFLSGQLAG